MSTRTRKILLFIGGLILDAVLTGGTVFVLIKIFGV